MRLQTPKGFRDFLPQDALKRQFVLQKITTVFQKFGFDPLETPALEYAETLQGKYGEDEKLIYQFRTPGGDEVALKYDQTVPLARVVAQYGPTGSQTLPIPFKRYQIQSAYRGENTQKGRYREFLQCDVDIVGTSSTLADAEILALVLEIYRILGLDITVRVNDRSLFEGIEPKYLATVDKLGKIGRAGVLQELGERGLAPREADELLEKISHLQPTDNLIEAISTVKKMGYPENTLSFDPTLVRGLDYYTGMICEAVLRNSPESPALGGGGRYDKLIGKFTGQDLPAVGFSVGVDRTIEAMGEQGVLDAPLSNTKVLVTVFSAELADRSLTVSSRLRSGGIPTELWLEPQTKLEKQLKYADLKGIPFAVIIGPEEGDRDKLILKNLSDRSQQILLLDELLAKLRQ